MIRLIPKYLIVLGAIVIGIVFLISFSRNLLLGSRNGVDIYVFTLYHATFLYLVVRDFWLNFLDPCKYRTTSSANNTLASSFAVHIPFISFSLLIALGSVSRIMLNRRGDSGHIYLAPHFRGKVFSFSPCSVMLVVGWL